MNNALIELRDLLSGQKSTPTFSLLKMLCVATWTVFLLKLSVIPIWLVCLPFILIFLNMVIINYIKLLHEYNKTLKNKAITTPDVSKSINVQPENQNVNNTLNTNIINSTDKISTNNQ